MAHICHLFLHCDLINVLLAVGSLMISKSNSAPERVPGSPLPVLPSPRFSMSPKLRRLGSVHLNLNQVARATCNFSPSMVLGGGGLGTVYKAELEDGRVVAIKRVKKVYGDLFIIST